MDHKTVEASAATVMNSPIVRRARAVLQTIALQPAIQLITYEPALWVPNKDYSLYYTSTIQETPLFNATNDVASRSCLLSFLSAIRAGRIGPVGVYASIGAYYRPEPVVTPGIREPIFPQLEIEVVNLNPEQALVMVLDLLQKILHEFDLAYEVRIQGALSSNILERPEIRYAGVDRHWKHYKTKTDVGFETYPIDSEDAIAGGGDFSELAWKFGLNPALSAVGFGLGLLRLA